MPPGDRERNSVSLPDIGGGFDDPDDSGDDQSPAERERDAFDGGDSGSSDPDPPDSDDDDSGGADTPFGFDDPDPDRTPTPPTPADREDATANPGGSAGTSPSSSPMDSQQGDGGGTSSPGGPDSLNRNPQPGANAPAPENEVLSTVANEDALARQFASRFDEVSREEVDITRTEIGGQVIARVDDDAVPDGFLGGGVSSSPSDRERRAAAGTRDRRRVLDELQRRGVDTDGLDVDVTDEGVSVSEIGGDRRRTLSPSERELSARDGVNGAALPATAPRTVGDIERAFSRGTAQAIARDRAEERLREAGADPTNFQIVSEDGRVEVERREEQFGDIEVENPLTGNRVETDLQRASRPISAFLATSSQVATEAPASTTGPVLGPLVSAGRTEGQLATALSEAGLVSAEDSPLLTQDPTGGVQGPTESAAESALTNTRSAFDPFAAAAEGKEIAEFVATQPPRVVDAFADATGDVAGTGVLGPAFDLSGQHRFTGGDDFVDDVEQRTASTVGAVQESARTDPTRTAGSFAGGLAGGAAVGTVIGAGASRIPGVSGSDLSGRLVLGGTRRIERLLDDTRAQGRVPDGGAVLDEDVPTITAEDIDDATRDPGQIEADPREDDIDAADPFQRRRERARRETEETTSGVLGDERPTREGVLDPRDRMTGRTDATEQRSVDVDEESLTDLPAFGFATGAASTTAAAFTDAELSTDEFAEPFASAEEVAEPVVGGDARTDVDAAGRVDTRQDVGTDPTQRTDTPLDTVLEADVRPLSDDAALDARQDTRQDPRQDDDIDVRFDTRQDLRADLRLDSRQDQRIDSPFEDDSDDDEERGLFGVDPVGDVFENPVLDPDEFLG